MFDNATIRRDAIETELDQPNRRLSTSSLTSLRSALRAAFGCLSRCARLFLPPSNFRLCLWFLAKNKNADAKCGFRDRRKQTFFIDARKLGTLIDRVHSLN